MRMLDIVEAVVTNLSTIPETQKSAYVLANPTFPAIQVVPGQQDYHRAMRDGHKDVTVTIQARVAWNNDVGSQKTLYRYLDDTGEWSVKASVESDRTLGGLCDDLYVSEASGLQVMVPASGGAELLCEWTVMIIGTGATG